MLPAFVAPPAPRRNLPRKLLLGTPAEYPLGCPRSSRSSTASGIAGVLVSCQRSSQTKPADAIEDLVSALDPPERLRVLVIDGKVEADGIL